MIIESPQFQTSEKGQAALSHERGQWPNESIQERGQGESKRIIRKKGFREISVTDIISMKSSAVREFQTNKKFGFIEFSKQFSHFVICPTFLSFLEVSDYLEIRKGCLYMHDLYDYSVLEDIIKFGNLDMNLRKNLWINVCPIISVQRNYREKLPLLVKEFSENSYEMSSNRLQQMSQIQSNFDSNSVYCNVYKKILQSVSCLEYLVEKIEREVFQFKQLKENAAGYEPDDFEVLANLALAYNFLFPEDANDKLAYFDAIYQGCRDEEIAFWILLCIKEKQANENIVGFRKRAYEKALEMLTQDHCPNFSRLIWDTKQTEKVYGEIINSFGCKFLDYSQSLPIIDSFLVCDWRGHFSRVLIMFKHIEDLINEWVEDGLKTDEKCNDSSSYQKSETNFSTEINIDQIESESMVSIREYIQGNIGDKFEMDLSNKEELAFETLVDIVEDFNKAYIINIPEKVFNNICREAFEKVVGEANSPDPHSTPSEQKLFTRIKTQMELESEKLNKDINCLNQVC